jgi:hypothetical protein
VSIKGDWPFTKLSAFTAGKLHPIGFYFILYRFSYIPSSNGARLPGQSLRGQSWQLWNISPDA